MKNLKKERAWINKKLSEENLTPAQLRTTVGMFSNKKKSKVMAQKNISSEEYDKRYNFLKNVYFILSDEY